MIRILVEFFRELGIDPGFFRLVDFLTFRGLMGMVTALGLSLLLGPRVIVFLYTKGFRDTSGEFLSISVHSKRGTPTGGGILILTATLLSIVIWGDFRNPFLPVLVFGFLYLAAVGFSDDFLKVRFRSSLVGLSQIAKTALLLLFAIPFSLYFVSSSSPVPETLRTLIHVPFYKNPVLDLGSAGFVLFAVFAIFSIINAVNITDGMDGLLGGTAMLTAGVYVVFAYVLGHRLLADYLLFPFVPGSGEVAVFGAVLIGSILGFLWFNTYPAQMFMGDTGSLSIGGALAMMAFFTKQEILFVLVGGVFVLEIFTSLLQDKIGMRLGRRLVYRAPFHYSVAHQGVAEPKVVMRLWILAFCLAVIGLLSLKVR